MDPRVEKLADVVVNYCVYVKPGDWVVIHMGFVVEKTDRAGADAAMSGLELLGRGRDPDASP